MSVHVEEARALRRVAYKVKKMYRSGLFYEGADSHEARFQTDRVMGAIFIEISALADHIRDNGCPEEDQEEVSRIAREIKEVL